MWIINVGGTFQLVFQDSSECWRVWVSLFPVSWPSSLPAPRCFPHLWEGSLQRSHATVQTDHFRINLTRHISFKWKASVQHKSYQSFLSKHFANLMSFIQMFVSREREEILRVHNNLRCRHHISGAEWNIFRFNHNIKFLLLLKDAIHSFI